jgi:molybdopterin-guanine dinucleotide biosynthesis protein A
VKGPVGVVLAGGASRRMGRDKALLDLGGETLAAGAARRLAAVCTDVVVADRGRGAVSGLPSLADGPGRGPAAGLLGAADAWPGRPLLALACDLPGVPAALLADLAESAATAGADWVVPRWSGGLEPLCSLWGPSALAVLAERVARGGFALHAVAGEAGLVVVYLEGERLAACGRPEEMFRNVNTPGELAAYTSRAPSGTPPQRSHGQISRRKS